MLRRHASKLGYPRAVRHLRSRRSGEPGPRRAARDSRAERDDAAGRPALSDQPLEDRVAPAAGGGEAATSDKSIWPRWAIAAIRRRCKTPARSISTICCCCTEELFEKHRRRPPQAEAALFDHLLVDEYQDTNGSQYRIVKALAAEHRNLCVVGDDDQSIYGWRGAEVQHILRFAKDWPDAKVVRLEENYRSTAAILELANRLIAFNKQRHDKVLRAARAGGEPPRILQYEDETDEARADGRRHPPPDRNRPAASRATSRSCFAPTSSRGRSRRSCGRRRFRTCCSAASRSSIARKCATSWRICGRSTRRATKSRCCGSSTRRRAASATRRSKRCSRKPSAAGSRSGTS